MSKQKYPFTHEEFKSIYSKVPRLTVELIVTSDEGVLLTKRAVEPYIGYWHIPGGTVYYKETMEDAIHRVAMNELGVEVNIVNFIGTIYYPELINYQGWDWPVGMAFNCKIIKGTPQKSDQGEECKFFKEIPVNIVPMQDDFLKDFGLLR